MSYAVASPLIVQDKVTGILCFSFAKAKSEITHEDMAMYKAISDQLALTLERMRAEEELRRANIQLRQFDQAKSDFVSIAAHQLRTPLMAIDKKSSSL